MGEFRMPALGADMAAGTLVEWKVKPGDPVTRGQIVAEVETDKGVIEVEIFESGVVEALLVAPGQKVPVGTPLARLVAAGGKPADEVAAPPPSAAGRIRISPLARRRAEDLGVDLGTVTGTGHGGAVTAADIEAAARIGKPAEPDRHAAMRRAIAAAMARSKREIPHYYLATEVEVSSLTTWLGDRNAKVPVTQRMLLAVPLLKAAGRALREVQGFNGWWSDGVFRPSDHVHLGVAISLRTGGLVAPAIHDADAKSLEELRATLDDLIRRVRGGTIRSSELSDPTATVTSLGDQGVGTVFGVIFPPQVAILGLGRITERPWVVDGAVAVRPVLTATLAADHRGSDGDQGTRLLNAFARHLAQPEALV
jgi:pyruvate dehydrogenase E2 component (dihydrolipoamide acetyltransferase)